MIPLHDDNPTILKPAVTVVLIVICVAVFLWQQGLPQELALAAVYRFGAIPAVVTGEAALPPELAAAPGWVTLFTSMFLHGGWMHLIGNMLYLWIFGNNVEDSMGHGRFIVFYLLCGLIAAFGHTMLDPSSTVPMVGASGAISGVLGAYLLLYPHARILVLFWFLVFFKTFRIRAMWVLGFWILLQVYNFSTMPADQEGGVAVMAHIAGFAAGMVLIPLFKKKTIPLFRRRPGPWG